jgi:hypothetical protein
VIVPKFIHDFVGHYNRPELFASLFKLDPKTLAVSRSGLSQGRSDVVE